MRVIKRFSHLLDDIMTMLTYMSLKKALAHGVTMYGVFFLSKRPLCHVTAEYYVAKMRRRGQKVPPKMAAAQIPEMLQLHTRIILQRNKKPKRAPMTAL